MKKIFLGAFVALMSISFVACNDDDPDYPDYYSYATVEKHEDNELIFRKDGGGRLDVVTTRVNVSQLEVGDRLIVYYDIKREISAASATESASYEINLYGGRIILTKDPLLQKDMTEEKEEEIGDDAFYRVSSAWYGGAYLNVKFLTYYEPYGKSHFINLVADDVAYGEDDTELVVTLRHNAYDEVPGPGNSVNLYIGQSIVSFNLVNLFEDMELTEYPAKVKLQWTAYVGSSTETEVKTMDLGKFVPWSVEASATSNDAENDQTEIK